MDFYYLNDNNYKDDVPFDLYNMVSLAKRIDFKTKLDIEGVKDITKEVVRNRYDKQNEVETVEDLAKKHLPKEVVEINGQFLLLSVNDYENYLKALKERDCEIEDSQISNQKSKN